MGDKVPTTDEEVLAVLERDYDDVPARAMQGLYRVLRAQGHSVLEAYEYVLYAFTGEVNDE